MMNIHPWGQASVPAGRNNNRPSTAVEMSVWTVILSSMMGSGSGLQQLDGFRHDGHRVFHGRLEVRHPGAQEARAPVAGCGELGVVVKDGFGELIVVRLHGTINEVMPCRGYQAV